MSAATDPKAKLTDIEASALKINRTTRPLPKCEPEELGFGKVISDHMLMVQWSAAAGWAAPEIVPSGPIGLHPFSHVFHYAIECYEGMKAYKDTDGNIRLFRPEQNMKRMNVSASRLCLPNFNGGEMLECIKELLKLDRDWIPQKKGYAMYLRPVMFSTTPWLGLTQCSEAMMFVLQSPVGPYFKSGFVPIKLHVDSYHIRAWPGGTGNVKFGGNYAPTVASQISAGQAGCSQALYVYGEEEWVTEAGTMNIFFLIKKPDGNLELVTPALEDGCILPGITRLSVLELAKEWGECDVVEEALPLSKILEACDENRVLEAFGTGTAAVLQPISAFKNKGKDYVLPENGYAEGSFQMRLLAKLKEIQYGETEHAWSMVV